MITKKIILILIIQIFIYLTVIKLFFTSNLLTIQSILLLLLFFTYKHIVCHEWVKQNWICSVKRKINPFRTDVPLVIHLKKKIYYR